MTIWDNLVGDSQVQLGSLTTNVDFKLFILELPSLLNGLLDEELTVDRLMEAQIRCADYFARRHSKYRQTREQLTQYEDAAFFLKVLNVTIKQYCQRVPGLTEEEFILMESGAWTVKDLLEKRPAVLLAPILRKLLTFN